MFVAHVPSVTLATAGILGVILVALSARVVMGRTSGKTLYGDGQTPVGPGGEASSLFIAVRSHANFAEYVPLCLILIAGLEMHSGPTLLVKVLSAVLVLARLAHPYGMTIPGSNPYRAGGFIGTMLVLVVASLAALATLFGS